MSSQSSGRAFLRLVGPEPEEPRVLAWFCGHCGQAPAAPGAPPRVCGRCGLGVMLETAAEAAPAAGASFLVLDAALSVCAVSAAAERALATTEPAAIDRPVTDLLVAADCESGYAITLADAVMRAAHGSGDVVRIAVRPPGTFGVVFEARVASCGPPNAALVVLT